MAVTTSGNRLNKLMKSKPVLIGLAWAVIGVGIIFWPHFHHGRTVAPSVKITSKPIVIPHCDAPDQSFCATRTKFDQSVTAGDAAGEMVESQTPVRISCNKIKVEGVICAGNVSDKSSVSVFAVRIGNTARYFMRNGYISLFTKYFAENGPFSLTDTTGSSTLTMSFVSKNTSAKLDLTFQKSNGTWTLREPVLH